METEQTEIAPISNRLAKATNTSPDATRLGYVLRIYREKLGWSQSQMAELMGIPQSYLSKIELHGIYAVREGVRDAFLDWLLE